jgi:hypothetical protein
MHQQNPTKKQALYYKYLIKFIMSFKKWCNENQGIFAFIAIIIAFIPVIPAFYNLPLGLKNGIISFIGIFILKVNIPIYIVLLFVILFFLLAYKQLLYPNRKHTHDRFSIKTDSHSKLPIIIMSDENTEFIGSKTYPDLPRNVNSFQAHHPRWIECSKKFSAIDGAKWIAHSKNITNQEAIDGGYYEFKKEFSINCSIKKISKAFLNLLVDDHCVVYLNGNILIADNGHQRVSGFDELHRYNVSQFLIQGRNEILFKVENIDFHKENKQGTSFFSYQNKGQHNPYGLIYTLIIE